MRYYIDTEFIEGFRKPLKPLFSSFGKPKHFIDLISIGIIAEDGRTYDRISNEYNYDDADKWVQENVITAAYQSMVHGDQRNHFSIRNFHKTFGIPNDKIKSELLAFFNCWRDQYSWRVGNDVPEFYGYYSDYDWVLFCSLFGRMIDLPKGFPMYCKDIKQTLDEVVSSKGLNIEGIEIPNYNLNSKLDVVKALTSYPKQANEHNALDDAIFNKHLHEWLLKVPYMHR